ncbi:MAG: hypothetical protein K8F25_16960, partial [Fimbriimonadaceae bacterium]|nr:hypothetical protein [Alphaproteobacteria bacterium]
VEDGAIQSARIAFGGMAGTPKRAARCEAALAGARLDNPEEWHAAFDGLSADYEPMSDHRASAAYRQRVARALLEKSLIEAGGSTHATRLVGLRAAAHV